MSVEALATFLQRPRTAVQFLGAQGCGKTTHLLAMRQCFRGAPYVRPVPGRRTRIPKVPVLFLDEVDSLPPRIRRIAFRRAGSLVIGSHRDRAPEMAKSGFDVRTIRPADHTDLARLQHVVVRRIESVRRGSGNVPSVPPRMGRELLKTYGTNLRAIEAHLYAVFQALAAVKHARV